MIIVLRLGHRRSRDQRLSTHVGLTARALGADEIVYSGESDKSLLKSVRSVAEQWGGGFSAAYTSDWKRFLKEKKEDGFRIVHLTMYGEPLTKLEEKGEDTVIVVGGAKVPGEVYEMADLNVSVGNQPHSEVAALSIVLDRLVNWEAKEFPGGEIKVEPCEKGKRVVKR